MKSYGRVNKEVVLLLVLSNMKGPVFRLLGTPTNLGLYPDQAMRTEHLLRPIRTLDIPLPAHGGLLMLLSIPVGFPLGSPGVTRTRTPPYAVKLTHSKPTSASLYGSTG